MDAEIASSVQTLLGQIAALLIYQSVLADEAGQAFLELLHTLQGGDRVACLHAYGRWFRALAIAQQTWQDYLLKRILRDDNPFTQQVQRMLLEELSPALVAAVQHDLQVLQQVYGCSGEQLSQWVQAIAVLPIALVVWSDRPLPELTTLKTALQSSPDWQDGLKPLAALYQQNGAGLLAEYRALRWQAGKLVGIAVPDPVKVTDLVGYETQRETLLKNTECLLRGYPALNVLLYGSRGSGKSSLVKGLLHQYPNTGLRLVEVTKADLQELPEIAAQLRNLPQKFIIFVDDLSFEEDENAFKALKVVLEGGLTARPSNVVVYATSNRRHLIREFFGDRPRPKDADEIHNWDTVQEKLSFSDRFGLTLTFEPADQTTYLTIIHHLANQAGISLESADLEHRALQWATRHNGRSGRTARQFIDFLQGELAIAESKK